MKKRQKEKILIKESDYYSAMKAKNCEEFCLARRAQVAIEHLTVTAVILLMVTIAFAFGFVTFDQNIKVAKANDALTALAGTANEVYALGGGNARFVDVSFPSGMPENYITIVNLCNDGTSLECPSPYTGNEGACDCSGNSGIKLSAIKLRVNLLGGETAILRETKAKLVLLNFPSAGNAANIPWTFRVSWAGIGKIQVSGV